MEYNIKLDAEELEDKTKDGYICELDYRIMLDDLKEECDIEMVKLKKYHEIGIRKLREQYPPMDKRKFKEQYQSMKRKFKEQGLNLKKQYFSEKSKLNDIPVYSGGGGCVVLTCPAIYEVKGKEVYLIIGKTINPAEAGLEKKVGDGESLIEVPRALIDKRKR